MMKGSIRAKITLWFISVLFGVLLMFSALSYVILKKSLINGVDSKLRGLAAYFSKRVVEPGEVFLQFLDRTGALKPKEGSIRNAVIPISLRSLRRAKKGMLTFETIRGVDGSVLRVVTYPFRNFGSPYYSVVQVATPMERINETMKTFLFIILITVPISVLFSALGGILITDRVLSPVKEMTKAARRISSENLSERLDVKGNDELSELASTFNDMIERLERSFNRIKEFSADVSHELRTPLTALKGQIEVALLRDRSKEEYRGVLESSLDEIERLTKVVNGLLTLSRGETGKIFLERERVHLEELVAEVVSQIYPMMEERNISFDLERDGEDVILGDRNLLKQAFLNLVENAVKYNVEGGSVTVEIQGSDGCVILRVRDTGVGIPEDEVPRIFEKFYRVEKSRARSVGGAGLGLSIVKWIVDAHGGKIEVESVLGKGTSFTVSFPKGEI